MGLREGGGREEGEGAISSFRSIFNKSQNVKIH